MPSTIASDNTNIKEATQQEDKNGSYVQRQLMAGAVGSIVTTVVLNPIGVLKVRTQAGQGRLFEVSQRVIKEAGVRGFWAGSGLGLVQSIPSTALYMTAYENIKITLSSVAERCNFSDTFLLGAVPAVSGAISRSMVVTFLAPLELVRTRTLAGVSETSANTPDRNGNFIKTMQNIYRTEGGFTAFYRGLGSTIMRDTPFSAIYWMSFETVKARIYGPLLADQTGQVTKRSDALVNFLSGSSSGAFAAMITHPFDVLKTQSQLAAASPSPKPLTSNTACARQVCVVLAECCCPCTSSVSSCQNQASTCAKSASSEGFAGSSTPTSLSMRNGIAQIIRSRGFSGLFSGLSMRLATIIPGSGIMITVYELAKRFDFE